MTTRTTSPIADLFASPPPKLYRGVRCSSRYLTMRDGVQIAVDIMLPADAPADTRLPAIMIMARYWRSLELRVPDQPGKAWIGPREPIADDLIPRGFAFVVVDVRGTGASTGVCRYPWSPEEIADYREVVTWVQAQPWCSGNIGATGISYEGSTALRVTATGVPGIKGVIPQEIEYDVYTDIACPGGIFNESFIRAWHESNHKLDNHKPSSLFPFTGRLFTKGVRPVDADKKTRTLLAQSLRDHQANTDVFQAMSGIVYRDDSFGSTGVTLDDFSIFPLSAGIEASGAALFSWGSWLDGASAAAALRTYNTYSNPQIAVIGAWKHEMTHDGSPFNKPGGKPNPEHAHHWEAAAQFFDRTLRQEQPPQGKRLYYYTLAEDTWKSTEAFQLPQTQMTTWYLQAQHRLAITPPPADHAPDRYQVDFRATTGKTNRWQTQMARPVIYRDRANEDRRLLTYTSEPLAQDMEITGYPVLTLHVASSEADGAFFVYLEDVDEQGVVCYITEGQLRGMHRQLSDEPASYWTGMPNHSFKRADAAPLPPGEVVSLTIGLQPTSVLIRRGHCIRVALAGADADTFARIPAQGNPTWQVWHTLARPSAIALPVIPR